MTARLEGSVMVARHWVAGRRGLILAATAAIAVLAAAGSAATTARASQRAGLQQLTITIGQYNVLYTDLFVASYEGFFRRAGVNVTIANGGSNFATDEISGHSDLAICGGSCTLNFASQGKDLREIYATSLGDREGYVVRTDSAYKKAADLSGASIGSFAVGQSKGLETALSNYVVSQGGKPLKMVTATTTSGDYGALVAQGVLDTALESPALAAVYIKAGKLRWVSDLTPGSKLMEKFFPSNVVGLTVWGPSDRLQQKKAAVTDFIAGMRAADRWMQKHKVSSMTTVLHNGVTGFQQEDTSLISTSLQTTQPVWNYKHEGYITQAEWTAALHTWSGWGLNLDLTQPLFNYKHRVDMSYWNSATKIVNKLIAKPKTTKKK